MILRQLKYKQMHRIEAQNLGEIKLIHFVLPCTKSSIEGKLSMKKIDLKYSYVTLHTIFNCKPIAKWSTFILSL